MNHRSHFAALVAALTFAGSATLPAQTGAGAPPADDVHSEVRVAPVVLDGETLFSVRGVTAHPADRRAGEIAGRIRTAAANRNIAANSLTLQEQPGSTWILAGGQRLMSVLDEDAAIEQVNRSTLAELYRARTAEAIEAYRRDRRPGVLWLHALYALAATLALFVAVQLGRRIVRPVRTALERRYRRRLQHIEDRAYQIVRAEQLWAALAGLLSLGWAALIFVAAYLYFNYALALFPWTRGLAKDLWAIAVAPVRTLGWGLVSIIPNLVFLTVLFLVIRYLLRLMRLFFEGVGGGTVTITGFDADWSAPTYRLLRLLVVVFAVVVAYPYIPGSGSDAFKGVSLFMGVVFSLGSSSLIGNLIAGYSMTYRRTFRVGDRVKVGEYVGDVERMRLMVTHLRTPKNEEVVVPNSTILSSEVVNYSSMAKDRGLILHTTVGIGYETPWRQVEAMLLEAASRTQGIRREPPPFILQRELGDFCVTYELNAYCDDPKMMPFFYTDLHRNILDIFNEFGVQIMTPHYEGDPKEIKVVPKDQWHAAPAGADGLPASASAPRRVSAT